MSRLVETTATSPFDRGKEFGQLRGAAVSSAFLAYSELFEASGASAKDVEDWGLEHLEVVRGWCPHLAEEIEGVAEGAGLPEWKISALNSRTEILGRIWRNGRGECSMIAALDTDFAPVAAQTWDWHDLFRDSWLVWGFFDEGTQMAVQTLTEAGILGKIGVNSAGVGVLLNIMHHETDGQPGGVPIHVMIRRILMEASTMFDACRLLASAEVSASSAVTIIAGTDEEASALTAELHPGRPPSYILPDERGILVHTNHFLTPDAQPGDREAIIGPDTFFRLDLLRRHATKLQNYAGRDLVSALNSHFGGDGALCCHPAADAEVGDRYETLATVVIHPSQASMAFIEGGPCGATEESWTRVQAAANERIRR